MRIAPLILIFISGVALAEEKPIAYPVPSLFKSSNGRYTLALIPPKSDDTLRPENSHHAAIRSKYSRSGLYLDEDNANPLWTVDWFDYEVLIADDGIHAVRIHGENDQWRHYKTDKRLPDASVREQLAAPAISIYRNGEALRTYSVAEIVARPETLPHTMRYILWNAGGVFTKDGKQFVLLTQDERQVFFNLENGRIDLSRDAGSKNAQEWVLRLTLAIVGSAIVAVLGIYFYHLRKA